MTAHPELVALPCRWHMGYRCAQDGERVLFQGWMSLAEMKESKEVLKFVEGETKRMQTPVWLKKKP